MTSHIFTVTKDVTKYDLYYVCSDFNREYLLEIVDLFKEFIEDGLGEKVILRAGVDSFSSYFGETVQIFDSKDYLLCQICDGRLIDRCNREITIDELKKFILIHLINEDYSL